MANLQYIGARYVPAFYENPDTGDTTWKDGVAYQALTIVSNGNAAYISRKPVPVGKQITDDEFWAKLWDGNPEIEELETRVDQVETDTQTAIQNVNAVMDGIAKRMDAIQYGATLPKNRRWVVYGNSMYDSYFTNALKERLQCNDDNFEVCITNTSNLQGFANMSRYADVINQLPVSNAETVTDVILLIGTQDFNPLGEQLDSTYPPSFAIRDFLLNCNQIYENATVTITQGFFPFHIRDKQGNHNNWWNRFLTVNGDVYLPCWQGYNARYLANANTAHFQWMDEVNRLSNDDVSFTHDGAEYSAMLVADALKNGVYVRQTVPRREITIESRTNTEIFRTYTSLNGNNVVFSLNLDNTVAFSGIFTADDTDVIQGKRYILGHDITYNPKLRQEVEIGRVPAMVKLKDNTTRILTAWLRCEASPWKYSIRFYSALHSEGDSLISDWRDIAQFFIVAKIIALPYDI